jgi:hypothetical protein
MYRLGGDGEDCGFAEAKAFVELTAERSGEFICLGDDVEACRDGC